MFRMFCSLVLGVCIGGSLWLSTVTEDEYNERVSQVGEAFGVAEDKVWEKIADHLNQSEEVGALQEKDLRFVRAYLRSRLGSDAYFKMAENNCLDTIVYKLAVYDSKWLDGWCANQYRHIEPLYKHDLLMYMSYKYEADQPKI